MRAILLLIELLGGESRTHALILMASLADAMGSVFAGAVREQAMHAWQVLVQCLAVHSRDMLRQVAPHIISHLLLVSEESPEGEHGQKYRAVQSAERSSELKAMEEVLHKLVVEHGQELGPDVLASIPALSPNMPVRRLAEIQQVRNIFIVASS